MLTDPAKRTIQAGMMMLVGEHGSGYAIAGVSFEVSILAVLNLYVVASVCLMAALLLQ